MLRWFETETYLEGAKRLAALNEQIEALTTQSNDLYQRLYQMCEDVEDTANDKLRATPLTLFGEYNNLGLRSANGFKWAFKGDGYGIVIELTPWIWSPEPHLEVQVTVDNRVETHWADTIIEAERKCLRMLIPYRVNLGNLVAVTPEV